MAVSETVKKGVYRIWDATNNVWKKYAFWTKASQVEFDAGTNLQSAVTQSLETESAGYVADARALKTLNDKFGGLKIGVSSGSAGYWQSGTFYPFSSWLYQYLVDNGVQPKSYSIADMKAAIGTKSSTTTGSLCGNVYSTAYSAGNTAGIAAGKAAATGTLALTVWEDSNGVNEGKPQTWEYTITYGTELSVTNTRYEGAAHVDITWN